MAAAPRKLALITAVSQEMAPLARRLSPGVSGPVAPGLAPRYGEWAGWQVALVSAGVGRERAALTTRSLLSIWQAELVLMVGVAGALDPQLEVGHVLTAAGVLAGEEVLSPGWVAPGLPAATLLSADRVLVTAAEKRIARDAAPAAHRPAAVEMETRGVAAAAAALGVVWGAVRAISDHADEALPLDFNALRTSDGDLPTSRVALAALRHPGAIPGLIRLGRQTTQAAEALAAALDSALRRG